MKTYAQYCPIAVALDTVGDRWSLLVLRELALGDQRFTDLRRALPGIAPNLLSARLTELGETGLVTRAELPPPAARTVYRLTPRGEEALPILSALARFGVRDLAPAPRPGPPVAATRAVHSLLFPWYRAALRGTTERLRAVVDGEVVDVVLGARPAWVTGGFGPVAEPEVTVTTTAAALLAARQQAAPLDATFDGPAEAVDDVLAAFALPPAAGRAAR